MNEILLNLQKARLRKINIDNVHQIFSTNFYLFTLRQSDKVLYKGNEVPKTIVDRGKFEILLNNTGDTSDFQCSNTIAGKRITNSLFAKYELDRINRVFGNVNLTLDEKIKLQIYTDYLETKLNEIDRFELIESWQKIITKTIKN
jgi:hypothetical protein